MLVYVTLILAADACLSWRLPSTQSSKYVRFLNTESTMDAEDSSCLHTHNCTFVDKQYYDNTKNLKNLKNSKSNYQEMYGCVNFSWQRC